MHHWPAGPCLLIIQISMNVQLTLVIMEDVKIRSMVIIAIVNLVILELTVTQVWKELCQYRKKDTDQSEQVFQRPNLHLKMCRRKLSNDHIPFKFCTPSVMLFSMFFNR